MKATTTLILLAARKTIAVMCFTFCFTLFAGFLSMLAVALAFAPSYLDTMVRVCMTFFKPFLRFDALRALGNTSSLDLDTSGDSLDTTSLDHDTTSLDHDTTSLDHDTSGDSLDTSRDLRFSIAS